MGSKLVKLMLVVSVLAVAAQGGDPNNVLTNPSFETSDTSGWWTDTPDANQTVSVVSGTADDGTYSAKITSIDLGGDWAAVGQFLEMDGSVDYDFSVAYNITDSNVADASAGYYIEFQNSSYSWLDGVWVDLYDTGGSWSTANTSGTTHADTAYVNIKLMSGDNTTTYYDDVVLTPEPATIALLALGSLRLLRKRK